MRIISVLAATGIGAAVGWVCGLVPVWPIVRLAAAAVLGAILGSIGIVISVFLTSSRFGSAGIGAVSFGVSEAVFVVVPAIALISVLGYFVLRRAGWSSASLATYGPAMLGGAVALITALWMVRGMTIAGG